MDGSKVLINNKNGIQLISNTSLQSWHGMLFSGKRNVTRDMANLIMLNYPNVMLEWYLHVFVVSSALPTRTESCKNKVEFYYSEDIALFGQEFVKVAQAAYNETVEEDNTICKLKTAGRRALHTQSINETGPCLPPMEYNLAHFHKFIRQKIEVHILNFKFRMPYKTTISNVLL
jgi:hypothetical protein